MKTIETLREVADAQAIITDPMRDMLAKYGADQAVEVDRMYTAFGTFVRSITIIEGAS
jgi:hypothetical protein